MPKYFLPLFFLQKLECGKLPILSSHGTFLHRRRFTKNFLSAKSFFFLLRSSPSFLLDAVLGFTDFLRRLSSISCRSCHPHFRAFLFRRWRHNQQVMTDRNNRQDYLDSAAAAAAGTDTFLKTVTELCWTIPKQKNRIFLSIVGVVSRRSRLKWWNTPRRWHIRAHMWGSVPRSRYCL